METTPLRLPSLVLLYWVRLTPVTFTPVTRHQWRSYTSIHLTITCQSILLLNICLPIYLPIYHFFHLSFLYSSIHKYLLLLHLHQSTTTYTSTYLCTHYSILLSLHSFIGSQWFHLANFPSPTLSPLPSIHPLTSSTHLFATIWFFLSNYSTPVTFKLF